MKRSPMPPRKKPMKRESKRRRLLRALTAPSRKDFLADVDQCMICDSEPCVDVHEIARGPAREAALLKPRLQMGLCRACHNNVGNLETWPLSLQIAFRILWEIRQTVKELNEVRGRAPTAVTAREVIEDLSGIQF